MIWVALSIPDKAFPSLVSQQRNNQTGEERKQTGGLSYSAESAEACEGHPQIALDQPNDQESSQQEQ
jgi:hypothetical protein